MKKLTSIIVVAVALCSSVSAGVVSIPEGNSKGPGKGIVTTPACPCFAAGFSLGGFGGAEFPTHGDGHTGLGGGLLAEYFITENVGLRLSYAAYSTTPVHHEVAGELLLRYPIPSLCIAPYVIAGGGDSVNGSNHGFWNAGAGLEVAIPSAHCLSVFLEGSYQFTSAKHGNDHTVVRLGVKYPF
jgi:opacity protein-like surface antigen